MKTVKYLSPTSISLFYKDLDQYYLNYLCEESPPRDPQTLPMAIGSSFDAYIKSYLYGRLVGRVDPKFDLENLFTAQVESQHRSLAWDVGRYLLDMYIKSGAVADLMMDLQSSIGEPKFEIEVRGVVNTHTRSLIDNVVLLGRPDLFFISKSGNYVILDFKVRGWCGRYNTSPLSGYVRLRNPHNRSSEHGHKSCVLENWNGMIVNIGKCLEDFNPDWSAQLAIYSWLLGTSVGERYIACIHEICCNGTVRDEYDRPEIRVAEHSFLANSRFQHELWSKIQYCWEVVHSDHIFRELSVEDSKARCELLDNRARAMKGDLGDREQWFSKVCR